MTMVTVALPSRFQTLPAHMVSDIVDFILAGNNIKLEQLLLVGCCKSCWLWRHVGVKKSLQSQNIVIKADKQTGKVLIHDSSARFSCTNKAVASHNFAKTLYVRFLNTACILDGSLCAALTPHHSNNGCWNTFCYTNANHLSVEIVGLSDNEPNVDMPMMAANAAQMLRQLVPSVNSVTISISSGNAAPHNDFLIEHSMGKLVSELIADMRSVKVVFDSNMQHIAPAITFTRGLANLTMLFPVTAELLSQVIHVNIDTLQSLYLQSLHPELACTLVSDSYGQPLMYPSLRHLRFSQHAIFGSVVLPKATSDHGVPFPRLESLVIENSFTFTSDLIFRKSFARLKRLCLPLTPNIIRIANQSDSFYFKMVEGRRIEHLQLETIFFNDEMTADYTVQATELALNLLSTASGSIKTLRLRNMFDKQLLMQAIRSENTMFSNLEKLSIKSLALDMSELTQVLFKIPRLTHLECPLLTDDSLDPRDAETMQSLVTYYSLEIFPLNKCFSNWILIGCGNARVADVACATLLIALSCPRLCSITHSRLFLHDLNSQLHELLENDDDQESNNGSADAGALFGRYKSRLRHLVHWTREL
ncbi:hypothetical protein LPJ64_004710 [Coemansia asiatica]|uniref:Uncharacterized protein n=1 Tax=Coemansia asiatica TaxID=1052880 RepID=A0A9W8CIS5_9FUNG|nr:hypothetical protein LPJ64_004710 [Coemansia asiatica]